MDKRKIIFESIWVGKREYLFLVNECAMQIDFPKLTKEEREQRWKIISRGTMFKDNKVQLIEGSLCGGEGTKTGRLIFLSVSTLMKMLDKKGYKYTYECLCKDEKGNVYVSKESIQNE